MENNKSMAWIVGIIAVVIIAGGAFWLINSGDDDADTATNEIQTTQQESVDESPTDVQDTQDIVALAVASEDLSTLVTAVQAADLVSTLQGDGPFTVFAPTNAAFEKLPEGTLATLLEPENVDQLSGILTYHVVAGDVMSSDLSDGQVIETVAGGTLTVSIRDEGVFIVDATGGEAQVITPDVVATNGVVHIIGSVLLPQ